MLYLLIRIELNYFCLRDLTMKISVHRRIHQPRLAMQNFAEGSVIKQLKLQTREPKSGSDWTKKLMHYRKINYNIKEKNLRNFFIYHTML